MKISNASKKVLASALSAAMVVAFAPTVAFAAPAQGDAAKIHFEVQTGANASVTDASLSIKDVNVVLDADKKTGDVVAVNAGNFKYYGASITGWWYDKDADGIVDAGEELTYDASAGKITSFVPADSFKGGDTITLKAIYGLPAVTAPTAVAETVADGTVAFTATNITAGTYDVKVTRDGAEVFSKANVSVTDTIEFTATETAADFNTLSGDTAKFDKSKYGEGKYVVSLTSTAAGATKGYTASTEFEVFKVSLKAADGRTLLNLTNTDSYVIKGGALTSAMIPASGPTRTDGKTFSGWYTADGSKAKAGDKVSANTELVATFEDARVAKPVANLLGDEITFSFENLAQTKSDATKADEVKSYTAKISGPGVDLTLTDGELASAGNTDITLNLAGSYTTTDGKWNSNVHTSAKPQAGKYTATLTQINGDGSTVEVGSNSIELVSVSYDLGEGNWNDANGKDKTADYLKALPTVAVKGGTMDNVWYAAGSVAADITAPGVANDSLNAFDKWAVSGLTKISDGKDVKEFDGKGVSANLMKSDYKVTGDVKLTATYKSSYAAAPAASIAGNVLTVEAAAGTVAYYKVGSGSWSTYTAPVTLADSATSVTVKAYAGSTASKETEFTKVKVSDAAANDYKQAKQAIAGLTDFEATKTFMANLEGYKKAVETADATFGVWNKSTDWGKVTYTATGTVMGSYADVAVAAVESYAAGVEQKDGSVKKLTAEKAADAKAAIAAVQAAWLTNNAAKADKDLVEINGTKPTNLAAGKVLATYTTAIKTITENAAKAMTTYKAEDVKAAANVTAALKAAKTADELNAALKAYGELNDAQKSLVATADVAAAQEALVKAELKDAQDDAAVSKVKGKTVKAKAKKATKSSLKVVTSKSGAKSTFKKVKGDKKVTVSKSGKIVVKKGLKAGKKYTVKVKATVGTQTKTVKVIVKVAK